MPWPVNGRPTTRSRSPSGRACRFPALSPLCPCPWQAGVLLPASGDRWGMPSSASILRVRRSRREMWWANSRWHPERGKENKCRRPGVVPGQESRNRNSVLSKVPLTLLPFFHSPLSSQGPASTHSHDWHVASAQQRSVALLSLFPSSLLSLSPSLGIRTAYSQVDSSSFWETYLFIGCAGSLLLHRLFSSCGEWGLLFVAVLRLLICSGFSMRSMGSRAGGLGSSGTCGSQVLEHRLNSCGTGA